MTFDPKEARALAARLKDSVDECCHIGCSDCALMTESAASITAALDEIERLHVEAECREQSMAQQEGEIAQLSEKITRLATALKAIARGKYDGIEITRLSNVECRIIANKALQGDGQ